MVNFSFLHMDNARLYLATIDSSRLVSLKDFSSPVSNIYRARVEKYIKSMDAFLLDIGLEKMGLLRKNLAPKDLKASDQIIVELLKEGQDDKLYEMTAKYSITDSYLVLVKNLEGKKSYKIFERTKGKSLGIEEKKIREQVLAKEFGAIEKEVNFLPTPQLIRESIKLKEAIQDSPWPVYHTFKDRQIEGAIYNEDYSPEYNQLINKGLKEVKSRIINLENGIELVFDQTEALLVIDINTRGFMMDLSKKLLSQEVNFAVLDDLARLISIKNIKKMIVIDFLRMNDFRLEKSLIQTFKEKLEKYNVKSQLLGFTKMGLFEMIVQ